VRTVSLAGKKGAGRVAIVDDEDYDLVMQYRWYLVLTANRSGRPSGPYARSSCKHPDGTWTNVYMHKLLTGWPMTDHENGDGLDNRRTNLRPASFAQNMANSQPKAGKTSAYRGVSWSRERGKWRADIKVDGRNRRLGFFVHEVEAAKAYIDAARAVWGEFVRAADIPAGAVTGEPPRGTCPVCACSWRLRKDGTLRTHHGYVGSARLHGDNCAGSGYLPADGGADGG
jgi:hypothetical protein